MTTVKDIVTDALEDLVVQSDEAPIEASEAKTAIRVLNQMMAMYASIGINLGYTEVDSLDDRITVPAGAMLGIVSNLATRLAPKYITGTVPLTLLKASAEGYEALLRMAISVGATVYPSTLPVGAGNSYPDGSTFYPDQSNTVLSEQNGSISLEDDTETP